ncbi:ATP-binding cassette domain-containing protein [Natronosporangium hydrolyticum]|uniref:ATP-binding cassette domain-containing protein n=1 Tax=Natronosporangium hydrolyticum TaxID=2811111 RepID=A0A895YMG1_9ACTN|nr:ATP-binding cassette domain-containing protein [Natronosporangium hydrolyticum]QSB15088.1 ATP-binding cassette domain-containing protein [Natronosporangium hydrolyticum]
MTAVIEIRGLQKTYRRWRGSAHHAVAGFDMTVEAGEVHGFLGPNGSGKTTTLRTLLGLIAADGGELRLLGRPVPGALPEVAREVGAIVESPNFFGNFTAHDTLSLLATAGDVPQSRVPEVVELVGLTGREGDRVKTYSLGMKQRLAVASALLKQPKLLILDEPANGLDPAGIREMRDLLRNLAANGMTVLLSSHILGEVQQICDSVTIIANGRRVAAGPVSDVLAEHATAEVRVRTESIEQHQAAADILRQAGASVTLAADHLLVHAVERPAWITRTLALHEVYVAELAPITVDLESVFLELTGVGAEGRPRNVDQPAPAVAVAATTEGVN